MMMLRMTWIRLTKYDDHAEHHDDDEDRNEYDKNMEGNTRSHGTSYNHNNIPTPPPQQPNTMTTARTTTTTRYG